MGKHLSQCPFLVNAQGLNIGDGRLNQKDSAEECRESCQVSNLQCQIIPTKKS